MQILITAGVGDFMAIESIITQKEAESIEHIYYASRQEKGIRQLIDACPNVFPNLTGQTTLFTAFTKPHTLLFCISNRDQLKSLPLLVNVNLDNIDDFGMIKIGKEFMDGKRIYKGSSFLNNISANVGHFNLPKTFVFLHPYSENARTELRDFNQFEWAAVIKYLEKNNIPGLVVNQGAEYPPKHSLIRDLTNQTTMTEAIQILKISSLFIGASSCFSVLAAKIFPPNKLFIKGHNVLKKDWWLPYYTPQFKNEYIYNELTSCPW